MTITYSSKLVDTAIIAFQFVKAVLVIIRDTIKQKVAFAIHRYRYDPVDSPKNVVIIGASFAGYHAAKLLANSLPTGYQVVLIERSSHFHFTWVFPRFSVVGGHEHKAFIPYGPYFKEAPKGSWRMIQDTVLEIGPSTISLQSGVMLNYEFLVLATGSHAGPPSRFDVNEKSDGIKALQTLQSDIRDAKDLVVVGGGAAGIELAADAKTVHPQKNVTLVHSRKTLLNKFGKKLHDAALEALEEMGVRVTLGERIKNHVENEGVVVLGSGTAIPCDFLVRCTGQKAASDIIAKLCPHIVSPSGGHVKVKSTLQIADNRFNNIYAAGDVIEYPCPKNGHSATLQAEVVSNNILCAIQGRYPVKYQPNMVVEGGIELTLGLDKNIIYVTDGARDIILRTKSKEIALKSRECWKRLGAVPFLDETWEPALDKS
ncbi:disulfide oxidoreductase, putative [Talaromyces stipitatus ATCC 10500]|uniref:Disulfide oxidoreductase, putative n=1 Tax=Talaromyces stipitatus (strain ATCC 10500 / CBS 375.48 / QM 6759 / NRRL 1006) TaxID=441959 RepID=B8M8W7_TALSN|nr:disulfide oxidoreductase, putative [Talaromyces stipitatus ATCC 10500]XP_002481065.1 disulfide oxidoreductase, putative [Talaromyces stipitatus ATCC 10500]EED20630.1 disulfide oxidoreductase, putative [Talaromyces stipitatus ATCC 10500]EED20631.1 disulfide oxidoreductase, putative [Talaromyces stipitatus ATCC 10500]